MIGEVAVPVKPKPGLTGREIAIPFRDDMRKAVLEGRKSCTTRGKRYGAPGDWFVLGTLESPRYFVLTDVSRLYLSFVANQLYEEEGVGSPEEFINLWKQIHPVAGWTPNEWRYTHFFEEVRP